MKKIIIIWALFVMAFCMTKAKAQDSMKWIPKINTGISAMVIQYVGGATSFDVNNLSAITTGVSLQKTDKSGVVQIAYNIDLLTGIKIGGAKPINLGLGGSIGLFNNHLGLGLGWFAGQKYPCGMINVIYDITKL